jgi:hypothetical protein
VDARKRISLPQQVGEAGRAGSGWAPPSSPPASHIVGAVERRDDTRLGRRVPGPYAPFMLPKDATNRGRTIYFTLSKWGLYNVFWYRADLVKKGDG